MTDLSQKKTGILLMLLSSLAFSVMQTVVSLTSRIPTMEQVMMRNIVCLVIAFALIFKNRLPMFGPRKYQPYLFGRSVSGFLGVVLSFYALGRAGQGDVTILNNLSPFFITLAAALFLKEKIGKLQIPVMLVAMVGALLVFRPGFQSEMLPLSAALLSAVMSAAAYTLLRFFSGKVDPITVIMHFCTLSTAASVPFVIADFVVPTPAEFVGLLFIGILGAIGQITVTYAYKFAPASEVSIFNYSMIPFAMILGAFVLKQPIEGLSVIGGGLVILAAVLAYRISIRETESYSHDESDYTTERNRRS